MDLLQYMTTAKGHAGLPGTPRNMLDQSLIIRWKLHELSSY